MKTIALLTLSCIPNYGAQLQTYATNFVFKRQIKKKGYDIKFEVFNFEPLVQKSRYSKKAAIAQTIRSVGIKNKAVCFYRLLKIKQTEAYDLHQKLLPFQCSYGLYDNSNKKLIEEYDGYVIGSDQTWNPELLEDNTLLLNTIKSEHKYSYAASFGLDTLPSEYKDQYVEALDKFKYISVREDVGFKILQTLMPKKNNYTQVLDPTLLMTAKEWSSIESGRVVNEEYILLYLAKPSDALLQFARLKANEMRVKLYIISTPDMKMIRNNPNYLGTVSPNQFISLIHHSESVVTNSFHGIAFSVIFEKNFYTQYNDPAVTKTNSRIKSILTILHLENRLITDAGLDNTDIDYVGVNAILENNRMLSIDYINKVLDDIGGIK